MKVFIFSIFISIFIIKITSKIIYEKEVVIRLLNGSNDHLFEDKEVQRYLADNIDFLKSNSTNNSYNINSKNNEFIDLNTDNNDSNETSNSPKMFNEKFYIYNYTLQRDLDNFNYFSLTPSMIRIIIDPNTIYKQKDTLNLNETILNKFYNVLVKVNYEIGRLFEIPTLLGNLRITKCIDNMETKYLLNGYNADLVIFPFIDFTLNNMTFGYGKACGIEKMTLRPVAGYIGISPYFLDIDSENWNLMAYDNLFKLIFNILAFDKDLFPLFYYQNNPARKDLNLTAESYVYNTINDKLLIIMPNVIKFGKIYYQCESFDGQLMNLDGKSWDDILMNGDILTNNFFSIKSISLLTFAFIRDTEWYGIFEKTGGLFRHLIGFGCNYRDFNIVNSFLENQCLDRVSYSIISSEEFSRQNSQIGSIIKDNLELHQTCSYNYLEKKICYKNQIVSYIENKKYYPGRCQNEEFVENEFLIEKYSKNSGCFMSSLRRPNNIDKENLNIILNSVCLSFYCDNKEQYLYFTVDTKLIRCERKGGPLEVHGYDGFILCPNYFSICTQNVFCFDIESCVNKLVQYNFLVDTDEFHNITTNGDNINTTYSYDSNIFLALNSEIKSEGMWYREKFNSTNVTIIDSVVVFNDKTDLNKIFKKNNSISNKTFNFQLFNNSNFILFNKLIALILLFL